MNIRSQHPPRSGFTLVEMLVVITIISILAALLIPGVQMALAAAQKGRNGIEISNLMMAMERYKSENGGIYPPSFGEPRFAGTTYATLFQNNQHKNTLLYRYITSAYPRISDNDIAYMFENVADNVDQSAALVFWLSQTTGDARNPFTSANAKKRAYFDFETKRLITSYHVPSIANRAANTLQLYTFKPPYGGDSVYVYLEAKHYPMYVPNGLDAAQGEAAANGDAVARAGDSYDPAPGSGLIARGEGVRPYLKAATNAEIAANRAKYTYRTDLTNYVNSESYQLICASLNGNFHASRNMMRRYPSGDVGSDFDNNAILFTDFQDDRDNQANFTEGKCLGDVQP